MNKYKKRYSKNIYTNFLFSMAGFISFAFYFNSFNLKGAVMLFFLLIIPIIFISYFISYRKKLKLLNSGIYTIDKMSGEQFEEFLLQHFKRLGYSGYVTRGSQDYGADIVIKKDGISVIIQAKRWNQKVGIEAVQQITAAIKHYNAQQGMVITNNYFTKNAMQLAISNNISLWDRNKLISVLLQNKANPSSDTFTLNNINKDICPKCGNKLIQRNGKNGLFLGCSGYPSCKYTKNL